MRFWERGVSGGRKHFRFEELDPGWILERGRDGVLLPYLKRAAKETLNFGIDRQDAFRYNTSSFRCYHGSEVK